MAENLDKLNLNRSEKAAFRHIAADLDRARIERNGKQALIADYARAEARIAELHNRERVSRGKAKATATRSLNVAIAERRRLHGALFGPRVLESDDDLPAEEIVEARAKLEALAAWRAYYWDGDRYIGGDADPDEETQLQERYGDSSIMVVLYASIEEEIEVWLAIEKSHRRARTSFKMPAHARLWLLENGGPPTHVPFRAIKPPRGQLQEHVS